MQKYKVEWNLYLLNTGVNPLSLSIRQELSDKKKLKCDLYLIISQYQNNFPILEELLENHYERLPEIPSLLGPT